MQLRRPTLSTFILFLAPLLMLAPALWPPEGWALGSHDMRGLFYPWWEFARNALWQGRLPLWDASRFVGYPFLSNPQLAFFYPPTWFALLLPLRVGISCYVLFHLWLMGWGTAKLVQQLSPSSADLSLGATAAGLTMMMNGWITARLYAGHIGLIAVHAWIPLLLLATHQLIAHRQKSAVSTIAFCFGMAILAGHTTSLIFLALLWGAFSLWCIFSARHPRALLPLTAAAFLGIALSAVQLLPTLQFVRLSARTASADYAFASDYSFPPAHLLTFILPEFFGEPTAMGYWSVPTFEELTVYLGLIPLIVATFALLAPHRHYLFWLLTIFLGGWLALGKYGHLHQLLFTLLPPFRLARAPARAMFLPIFALAVLMGLFIAYSPQRNKRAWGSWGAWLLGCWIGLLVTATLFTAQHPSETSGRLWHQLGGWSKAMVIVMAFGLWWWRGRDRSWARYSLLLLISADLWLFGGKFLRPQPMHPDPIWHSAAKLLAPLSPQRILPWGIPIFAQNGAGQVGLASVFGYNALEVGYNTQLHQPDPRALIYDLFSADYLVANTSQEQFVGDRLQFVAQSGDAWLYRRPHALPLVRIVPTIQQVADLSEINQHLAQPDFDPRQTALLWDAVPCAGGEGSAELLARADGYWQIRTQTDQNALLVVSETAYDGWQVQIDGKSAEWHTAYGTLRAVCVPPGEHIVTWRFRPTRLIIGGTLSLFALALIAYHTIKNHPSPQISDTTISLHV